MHELSIASDLSEIVLNTAAREKLSRVTVVNVSLGRLVQIVPDIFEIAFSAAVKDTAAQDAEINIEIIPVRLSCRSCSSEFGLDEDFFTCKVCGSSDINIINGKELFIKSIEGE